MGSDVVGGVDEDKSGKVAHGIHEVGLATVIGDLSRSPEIDVEDVEGAAEGPAEGPTSEPRPRLVESFLDS
jgi:hypothetical protein